MQHTQIFTKVKRMLQEIVLMQKKPYSVKQLAQMYKVNKRSIQRDLQDIREIGKDIELNLEFVKDGCYKVVFHIPKAEVRYIQIKEEAEGKKEIVKKEEYSYFNSRTKNTAIIKQDNAGKYFYYIKDLYNKTTYISDKFETLNLARKDLRLAI